MFEKLSKKLILLGTTVAVITATMSHSAMASDDEADLKAGHQPRFAQRICNAGRNAAVGLGLGAVKVVIGAGEVVFWSLESGAKFVVNSPLMKASLVAAAAGFDPNGGETYSDVLRYVNDRSGLPTPRGAQLVMALDFDSSLCPPYNEVNLQGRNNIKEVRTYEKISGNRVVETRKSKNRKSKTIYVPGEGNGFVLDIDKDNIPKSVTPLTRPIAEYTQDIPERGACVIHYQASEYDLSYKPENNQTGYDCIATREPGQRLLEPYSPSHGNYRIKCEKIIEEESREEL